MNTCIWFTVTRSAPLIEETIVETTYGEPYSTALQKNNFYGVQFILKSSKSGSQPLSNFLALWRIIPAMTLLRKCVRLSKGDYST